jgi:Tfp pilus assembly protein PilN
VNLASVLNQPPLFVEIGPDRLQARQGDEGVELPLERGLDGRITALGKDKIIAALKNFLKAKAWQPRTRAWCAINTRGVSLRRLTLPGGTKEEFHERLLLQIEGEFPLPPDELAWGWQPLGQPQPSNGAMARQDLLVAAVRKEVVAEYSDILRACGTEPVFTLAALARWNYCGQPADSFAMLDIGASQAELTTFENGVPTASSIIFWDGKNAGSATDVQLGGLAQNVKGGLAGMKLFVSGNGVSKDFAGRLERALGRSCECKSVETTQAEGGSAAVLGLEKFAAQNGSPTLLIRLQQATVASSASFADLDLKKWGTRVGALVAAVLLLPYAEAFLLKPHLEKKVAAFKTGAERLVVIDRELDFLRDLKLSQPPYIDVLYVLSKSVPPGTRFDSLSLNSHGEISLRGAFHDGQQVADFRDKLIASDFFTNVVVEEQVPTPDRQRVNVRLSALEKTAAQMQLASARLTADDSNKDTKTVPPGGPSGGRPVPPVLPKETK